ncbi:LPXTG cell wall anchor domain-containing protein [Leucobacter sp. 1207-22]
MPSLTLNKTFAKRARAGFLVTALALVGVATAASPALAEENHHFQSTTFGQDYAGTGVFGTQTFYVYMNEGESLTIDAGRLDGRESSSDSYTIGTRQATATVTDPSGVQMASKSGLGLYDAGRSSDVGPLEVTAESTGIHTVTIGPSSDRYASSSRPWKINVSNGEGEVSGRVFVTSYNLIQPTRAFDQNIEFYTVNEYGIQYNLELPQYNGWNSVIAVNAFGNVDRDTCQPTYASDLRLGQDIQDDAAACGGQSLMFFETPAADLPATAAISPASPLAGGASEHWLLPAVTEPTVTNLEFTPTGTDNLAGELSYSLNGHTGVYTVKLDADGDGRFDGALDREILVNTVSNPDSYEFDGLDANGDPIAVGTKIGFRVEVSQAPEAHVVLFDVETMGGGVKFTRLNGSNIESDRIYWNDTPIQTGQECSPAPSEVDTKAEGVPVADAAQRGWTSTVATCNDRGGSINGTWGNDRSLDTWTYGLVNAAAEITYGGTASFTLKKTATNGTKFTEGDEVEWAFTVNNTGNTLLSNIVIEDELLGFDDWLCVDSLPAGETVTCDAPVSYRTTTKDVATGRVVNVANAVASPAPGVAIPDAQTASAEVTVIANEVDPTPEPEPTPEPGSGVGTDKPSNPSGSNLANTGAANIGIMVAAGGVLIVAGIAIVMLRRKTRSRM